MTEQDIEVVKERLEQVWSIEGEGLLFSADSYSYQGHLSEKVRFNCYCYGYGTRQDPYTVMISDEGEGVGTLYFSDETIYDHYQGWRVDEEFVRCWLPFFRRSCWLSGCDIEASAHEKAEWMRGFSKEEIKSWDLKM